MQLSGEGTKNRLKMPNNTFWALSAAGAKASKVRPVAIVEVENIETWNVI